MKSERSSNVHFFKKAMSPKEIHEDFIESLGKESSYSTVTKWAAEFKGERESVEDDGRSGCPKDATADETVTVVHTLVMCDRGRDLRSIASEVGITINPNRHLFRKMRVPQMMTNDQERTPLDISRYLLSHYEDDPCDFIERHLTQDETWVHHFDPESKVQSKQWKHPGSSPPMNFKRVHPAGKVMVSIFWNSQGVIMIDYLEQYKDAR